MLLISWFLRQALLVKLRIAGWKAEIRCTLIDLRERAARLLRRLAWWLGLY